MKRLFIILAVVVMAVSGMAQEHLKVWGHEMKGSLTEFAEFMVTKEGWQIDKEYSKKHSMCLKKVEAGGIHVTAEIEGTPISNSVYAMTLYYSFSNTTSWKNTKALYDTWNTTYGAPIEVKESFDPPYSETNNPIEALCNGKGRLYKVHQVKGGKLYVEAKKCDIPEKKGKLFFYTCRWVDTQNDLLKTKEEKPLKFVRDSYYFTDVYAGPTVKEIPFEFENTCDFPIVIKKIGSTTTKTTAEFSKEPVSPKGKGKVVVKWNLNYKWGDISDGALFNKTVKIYYEAAGEVHMTNVHIRANHVYLPKTEIYNKHFGKLSLHRYCDTWNYKLCDTRQANIVFQVANLSKENIDVKIVYYDSISSRTTVMATSSMKPGDESVLRSSITFDGKHKVEKGHFAYYVNNKLEGKEPASFILWNEADEQTQNKWSKAATNIRPVGCKTVNRSYDYDDDY